MSNIGNNLAGSGTCDALICFCQRAEVPCSQVVGFAKKAMEDAVGTSSQVASCPVVRGLSKLKANDAEDRLHPLLAKHNLSLPIDLTPLSGDLLEGYPRLKPLHFLEYMAANGYLNRLLGGKQVAEARPMLEEFWRRFEVYHPDFGLFLVDDPDVELGLCIPVFAHADGGRGYKKSEFMVFNWSSVCGSGTAGGNKKDHSFRMLKRGKKEAQINLLGHSYGTHYMYSVMPAAWHKDDSCFQAMMTEFGKDLHECFETGVLHQGLRLRLVVLGLKADLKLRARAGRFTRWYSTCRKGPLDPTNLKQSPGLCCWLCPAGDVQFPFEEIHTDSPKWFEAIGEWAQWVPWRDGEISGLVANSFQYLSQPAKFFLPDLFHVYLAGFGQDHAGSCLVAMLGTIFVGTSVDAQLASLNTAWRTWKK